MHQPWQQVLLLPPHPVASRPYQLSALRNPCGGTAPSGPGSLPVPRVPDSSEKHTGWEEQTAPESSDLCLAFGKRRAAQAPSSRGQGPAHAFGVTISLWFTKPSASLRITLAETRENYLFCYRKPCHLLQGHVQDHCFHRTSPFPPQPSSLTHPSQNIEDYIWVKL